MLEHTQSSNNAFNQTKNPFPEATRVKSGKERERKRLRVESSDQEIYLQAALLRLLCL
jgi:hypothetical protein